MAVKKKMVKKKKKAINAEAVPVPRLSTQDKMWRAQDDARVLAQAEDVKKDGVRLKAAKAQAKKMAREQEVSLASIKKIAEGK
jgi:hypothetical protein